MKASKSSPAGTKDKSLSGGRDLRGIVSYYIGDGQMFEDAENDVKYKLVLRHLCPRLKANFFMELDSVHEFAARASRSEQGTHLPTHLLHPLQ